MNTFSIDESKVVNASRWFKNGDHPLDYAASQVGFEKGELREFSGAERKANGWEGGVVRYFRDPEIDGRTICAHCQATFHEHGWIDTGDNGRVVCPGDWIIADSSGEFHPCKPALYAVIVGQDNAR